MCHETASVAEVFRSRWLVGRCGRGGRAHRVQFWLFRFLLSSHWFRGLGSGPDGVCVIFHFVRPDLAFGGQVVGESDEHEFLWLLECGNPPNCLSRYKCFAGEDSRVDAEPGRGPGSRAEKGARRSQDAHGPAAHLRPV